MRGLNRCITLAKDLRRAYRFNQPYITLLYKGVYNSYAEASRALPQQALHGFDHEVVVNFFQGTESRWKYLDYPAAFWLREALRSENTLIDLGGGWGQTYYAYQKYLTYPQALSWTVCDLQAFTFRGQEIASERGASQLHFAEDIAKAGDGGIFFTGGALQYLEDDLSVLLHKLKGRPRHIVAHHIPMYDGPDYYTIQKMSHSYVVYKIMNRERFLRRICALGYELRDAWIIPRTVDVMFHPAHRVTAYSGFYFRSE